VPNDTADLEALVRIAGLPPVPTSIGWSSGEANMFKTLGIAQARRTTRDGDSLTVTRVPQ
jgi:hypothetical protein